MTQQQRPRSTPTSGRIVGFALLALVAWFALGSCGDDGPPAPPTFQENLIHNGFGAGDVLDFADVDDTGRSVCRGLALGHSADDQVAGVLEAHPRLAEFTEAGEPKAATFVRVATGRFCPEQQS